MLCCWLPQAATQFLHRYERECERLAPRKPLHASGLARRDCCVNAPMHRQRHAIKRRF